MYEGESYIGWSVGKFFTEIPREETGYFQPTLIKNRAFRTYAKNTEYYNVNKREKASQEGTDAEINTKTSKAMTLIY